MTSYEGLLLDHIMSQYPPGDIQIMYRLNEMGREPLPLIQTLDLMWLAATRRMTVALGEEFTFLMPAPNTAYISAGKIGFGPDLPVPVKSYAASEYRELTNRLILNEIMLPEVSGQETLKNRYVVTIKPYDNLTLSTTLSRGILVHAQRLRTNVNSPKQQAIVDRNTGILLRHELIWRKIRNEITQASDSLPIDPTPDQANLVLFGLYERFSDWIAAYIDQM